MFGLLHIAKQHFGDNWHNEVGFLTDTALKDWQPFALPKCLRVIIGVDSPGHWALLAIHFGFDGLLYDGMENSVVKKRAACAMDILRTTLELEMKEVVSAGVSPQSDDWSCGMRVLACADAILRANQPMLEVKSMDLHGLATVLEASARASGLVILGGGQVDASQTDGNGAPALSAGYPPLPSAKANQAPAGQTSGACSSVHPPIGSAPANAAPLGGQLVAHEPSKENNRKTIAAGRQAAARAGIDYNKTWQRAHAAGNINMPEGHWDAFCIAVAKGGVNPCRDSAVLSTCLLCLFLPCLNRLWRMPFTISRIRCPANRYGLDVQRCAKSSKEFARVCRGERLRRVVW